MEERVLVYSVNGVNKEAIKLDFVKFGSECEPMKMCGNRLKGLYLYGYET